METERQQSIASSLPLFGIVAIIAAAYYVSRLPLESSRPESPLGLEHVVPEKDKTDARLWQDPIKVALDHEKAMHRQEPSEKSAPRWQCISDHCVNQVSERIDYIFNESETDPKNTIVHVLLIIVRDGNFVEDHERRLRNRYAVLTALSASGLAPEDSERIQYFKLLWTDEQELEGNIKYDKVPKISQATDWKRRSIIVPFEWFVRLKFDKEKTKPDTTDYTPDYTAVVWLSERAFSHRPLTRLAQVIDAIGNTPKGKVTIDVIGPSYSDTLLAMLKEIEYRNKLNSKKNPTETAGTNYESESYCGFVDVNSMLSGLTIFSPWSTASPVLLMREADMNSPDSYGSPAEMFAEISEKFQSLNINFLRMIGTDDLLVLELIRELHRRGANILAESDSNDFGDVALITEWDTFYGKAFPLIFATMMESIDFNAPELNWIKYTTKLKQKIQNGTIRLPDNLRTYSYIRGVDGKLPQSQLSTEEKPNEQVETESKLTYTKSLELPNGRSQLDYVRRLAQDIKDEWEHGELKAIGVVGSDVYDKLILLHALREEFDDLILFTTDIDARLMHYEQFKWTRNVIVASNYGLELNDYYQRGIYQQKKGGVPPFRDNYQTSLFFTCRSALGLRVNEQIYENNMLFRQMSQEQLTHFLKNPRLFELGRGRAVDVSVDNGDIHPPTRPRPGRNKVLKFSALILAALVFFVLLLAQINTKIRIVVSSLIGTMLGTKPTMRHTGDRLSKKEKEKEEEEKYKAIWEIITVLSILAVVIFVAVVIVNHFNAKGEPFSLVAGVSIWPGEALRLIATILSVCFLVKAYWDLHSKDRELDEGFHLNTIGDTKPITFAQWRETRKRRGYSKSRLISWPGYCHRISFHISKMKTKKTDAKRLWKAYLMRGTCSNRYHRLIAMSLTYFLLAAMLMLILGTPGTPYRGTASRIVDRVLLFSSVASFIILIFFVVDATKLCLKFVRNLKTPTTIWPKDLLDEIRNNNSTKSSESTGQDKSKNSEDQTAKDQEDKSREDDKKADKTQTNEGQIDEKDLAEWLDIKFIASYTEAVGKLIYYPFIILLFMFLARSRYFDNWDFPISLIIIFLLNSTFALCCGCMLRREAENTRRVALGRLQKKLTKAMGAGHARSTLQLGVMIEEIKSIRQGAYSPFTSNPVLHAILIPSGGISLISLLMRFVSLS